MNGYTVTANLYFHLIDFLCVYFSVITVHYMNMSGRQMPRQSSSGESGGLTPSPQVLRPNPFMGEQNRTQGRTTIIFFHNFLKKNRGFEGFLLLRNVNLCSHFEYNIELQLIQICLLSSNDCCHAKTLKMFTI